MNPLLTTLGNKLAERWLNLLVLPGALFLGVAAAGTHLGHSHWYDAGRLREALDDLAARPSADRPGTAALLVAAALLLAAAASLAAQFLGAGIERLWLRTARDPLSRLLVERRRRRWRRRETLRREAYAQAAATRSRDALRIPPRQLADIQARTAARDRVALLEPTRPTWYGDRMQATAERVDAAYGVDLAALWPGLWLILAEPAQRQVQQARDSFTAAARLAAWSTGYAALALWWWPAALLAVGCGAVARVRARDAVSALASLIEAAVDVHGRELAVRMGLLEAESHGRLEPETGEDVSELFRKAD
jgi:hypothetical protein